MTCNLAGAGSMNDGDDDCDTHDLFRYPLFHKTCDSCRLRKPRKPQ